MIIAVQAGYYSGIIAGTLVDKFKNLINFSVAAFLALISYAGLAWTIGTDFGFGIQLLSGFLFFLAGLSASIGTVCSIASTVKNFDWEVSTLLVAIMVTYMKMAQTFDLALKDGFFSEGKMFGDVSD